MNDKASLSVYSAKASLSSSIRFLHKSLNMFMDLLADFWVYSLGRIMTSGGRQLDSLTSRMSLTFATLMKSAYWPGKVA